MPIEENALTQFRLGQHVEIPGKMNLSFVKFYMHHAIISELSVEHGVKVIHWQRLGSQGGPTVQESPWSEFLLPLDIRQIRIVYTPQNDEEAARIIQRAKSKIGKVDFNIVFRNCEHFANWCTTESFVSHQVNQVIIILGVIILAGVVVFFNDTFKHMDEQLNKRLRARQKRNCS